MIFMKRTDFSAPVCLSHNEYRISQSPCAEKVQGVYFVMETKRMIIFQNVSKFILTDVSFCVPKGRIVGVIGASGAGKTTLLKLVCGLLEAAEGEVYCLGRNPVASGKLVRRRMASLFADIPVFQQDNTINTSFEELRLIYGMGREEYAERYGLLGEKLGFRPYENTAVRNLSLGERRRAELGTLFLRAADLLVLDEPGIGLDRNAKAALGELLRERKEAGATILISSHDMEEISGLCERILLLDEGRLIFYGEKDMLLKKYAPMDVCELEFDPKGRIPGFEDLPLYRYELEKNHLTVSYNANLISAAEILSHAAAQTEVLSVKIRKGSLLDTVKNVAASGAEQLRES